MNEVQEAHTRQALKDIWDAAKLKKGNRADDLGRFTGELMTKISTILKFDFDEEYPMNADALDILLEFTNLATSGSVLVKQVQFGQRGEPAVGSKMFEDAAGGWADWMPKAVGKTGTYLGKSLVAINGD